MEGGGGCGCIMKELEHVEKLQNKHVESKVSQNRNTFHLKPFPTRTLSGTA